MNILESMWQQFSRRFVDKLTSEELWDNVFEASIRITLIILLAWVVVQVGRFIIRKVFRFRANLPGNYSERRRKTIERLLQSIISYVVYFSAIMASLSAIGINIAGLLAGAGIAGLAIGFGAQSLVKDVITGFFIIFEDQFGVGDYIQVGGREGTVVEIGLRTTKVKGNFGEMHIIPNGAITDVINYSLSNSIANVDFTLGYTADIEKAERLVRHYLETLPAKNDNIVTVPTLLGVQNMGVGEMTWRISVETLPLQHYGVARMIRKDLITLFEDNHIDLPYAKMMVYDQNTMNRKGGSE